MNASIPRYILKRVLLLIPLLLGITAVSFALVRIGDQSPVSMIAGPTATAEQLAAIEQELGLDRPLLAQYFSYLNNLLHGDLGTSWVTGKPVLSDLTDRLPATLELVIIGMALSVTLGLVLGFLAAKYRDSAFDHVVRFGTLLMVSLPVFWIGIMLINIFYFNLKWSPAPLGQLAPIDVTPTRITGAIFIDALFAGPAATLQSATSHLVLPALAVGSAAGAAVAKQTRALIIEASTSDAVRYARACGLPERQVSRLKVRMALPGLVTFIAISFIAVLGGSALIELIFAWGGAGQYALQAITNADFAAVQGYVLIMGIIGAVVYLAADLLVLLIDPRIHHG